MASPLLGRLGAEGRGAAAIRSSLGGRATVRALPASVPVAEPLLGGGLGARRRPSLVDLSLGPPDRRVDLVADLIDGVAPVQLSLDDLVCL